MRVSSVRSILFTLALSSVLAAMLGAAPATRPASPELPDVTGVERRPLDVSAARAVVVVFISTECPISNGYAPEINRLCRAYEANDASFYLVHADADLTDEAAARHAKEFGFTCPVLVDRKHALVQRLRPRVTPEAVVLDKEGRIAYRGRIDDQFVALGKRRYAATTHDLRDAVDAVLAGKPVATPRTVAVGCAIGD